MSDTTKPYAVCLWGSKPGENDDCWTGKEFSSLEEAVSAYNNPSEMSDSIAYDIKVALHDGSELWVELSGKGIDQSRCISPGRKRTARENDDHRREMAMEAGMAFGCDAYNDMMGWS
jgi:hypothetical protein